ncbi:hypothetical protein LNP17_15720 [Klebsiella variicola subsp. variicola]|nr:hypothetical protein [Klebsiella variicola subsp. variicola]
MKIAGSSTFQLGGVQQLGNGFATQLSTDVMWYGVNDDASGIGTGRLKQDNTYQFQGWVTWTPPADKSWTLAAGYSQYWGGKQQLDGIENGQATRVDRGPAGIIEIRHPHGAGTGVCSSATSTSMAVLREDLHTTLRVMKLF